MKESPRLNYEKVASENTHILHLGLALELGHDLLTLGAGRVEVANHVESSWYS